MKHRMTLQEKPFAAVAGAGVLEEDDDREVKVAMLEKMPILKEMYSPDDGNMQMLYFQNATATFSSFTSAPEVICF